jgi:hypothetical protein
MRLEEKTELRTYLDEVRADHDYDLQLADAIRRAGNVILGIYHFFNEASAKHLFPEKHAVNLQLMNRIKYTGLRFPSGSPPHRYAFVIPLGWKRTSLCSQRQRRVLGILRSNGILTGTPAACL